MHSVALAETRSRLPKHAITVSNPFNYVLLVRFSVFRGERTELTHTTSGSKL